MKKLLTAKFVESVKPTDERQQFTDTAAAGLIFMVQTTGKKSWGWKGRIEGKSRKLTLGSFPKFDLASAREWAQSIIDARDNNQPIPGLTIVETEAESEAEEVKSHRTLDWMFDLYMKHEGNSRRTAKEKRQIYEREVKPHLGDTVVEEVTYDDLATLVIDKAEVAPGASNNLQVQIRRLFRWAVTKGRSVTGLKNDVARDLVKMAPINKRSRHFDDYEIGVFFRAIEQCPTQINEGLLVCLYLGVRRSEAFDAEWREFDLEKGVWIIPPARVKNKTEHVLPLPAEIVLLLKARKLITGNSKFVWPGQMSKGSDDPKPIDQFTKPRAKLRDKMLEIAAAEEREIEHWTIHDLRRTLSSGMNAMLDDEDMPIIDADTVERVINHKIGGVAGVYNRFQYFAPKKKALRLWADHLDEVRRTLAGLPSMPGIPTEATPDLEQIAA